MSLWIPLAALAFASASDEDVPLWKRPWTPPFPPLIEPDFERPASLSELLEDLDSLLEERDAVGLARILVPQVWAGYVRQSIESAHEGEEDLDQALLDSNYFSEGSARVSIDLSPKGEFSFRFSAESPNNPTFTLKENWVLDAFWPSPVDLRIRSNRTLSTEQYQKFVRSLAQMIQSLFGEQGRKERHEFRIQTLSEQNAHLPSDCQERLRQYVERRIRFKGWNATKNEKDFLELMKYIESLSPSHGTGIG